MSIQSSRRKGLSIESCGLFERPRLLYWIPAILVAILIFTVFHGIRGGRYGWRFGWALATLTIAVTYAGLDEWHQSFVPMREARMRDVAIDALGAVLTQTLVWLYAKWRSNFVVPSEYSADAEEK